MNNENIFYVYLHRRKTDKKVFYVGKGKESRAYSASDRNNHWHNVKNKHGLIVEIVFDNLSEKEAFQVEVDTILEMKCFGYPLCNMTNGGEGVSGLKQTSEHIAKRVAKNTGRTRPVSAIESTRNSLVGHRLSLASKEKLRIANIPSVVFSIISKTLRSYTTRKRNTSNKNSFKRKDTTDYSIYKFKRDSDNLMFIGTRLGICNKFELNQKDFGKLFYVKGRITSQGWRIIKETNDNNTT